VAAHPAARRRDIWTMTKINGTEPAVYDPSVAQGYVHVSAALVDAACNAWFARKGIRYQALGRAGLSNKLRERASQDRKRNGEKLRKQSSTKRASVEDRRVCHRACPAARSGSAASIARHDANSQGGDAGSLNSAVLGRSRKPAQPADFV
jgi:hypothetical protein